MTAIGSAPIRRDARLKVTGTATYAYEVSGRSRPAYCHPVQARIARGRIIRFDTAAAEALDGVLGVLTPDRAERLASTADAELAVLQSDEVSFRGQIVGAVLAETSEAARHAASLVRIAYDEAEHDAELSADRDDLYRPEKVNPDFPTDSAQGDVETAGRCRGHHRRDV